MITLDFPFSLSHFACFRSRSSIIIIILAFFRGIPDILHSARVNIAFVFDSCNIHLAECNISGIPLKGSQYYLIIQLLKLVSSADWSKVHIT